MTRSKALKSALACALALGVASTASVAMAAPQMPMQMTPQMIKMQHEKTMKMMKKDRYMPCYGVNAAYKNDCKSPGHSCAGQDSKARDPQAFVAMPAGLCTKIAGGSLTEA
ncbi:MAG: BufA1 family periplasmic bufferin-type metallophore [Gammaproteobacteria bacterium]